MAELHAVDLMLKCMLVAQMEINCKTHRSRVKQFNPLVKHEKFNTEYWVSWIMTLIIILIITFNTMTLTFSRWNSPQVCRLELFIFLTLEMKWYMLIWLWPSFNLTFTFWPLFQEAVSKMGGIDILILNHILPIPLGMWEGSPQNLTITDKIVDVNSSHLARSTSSGRLQWQHHCGILSGRSCYLFFL